MGASLEQSTLLLTVYREQIAYHVRLKEEGASGRRLGFFGESLDQRRRPMGGSTQSVCIFGGLV